MNYSILIYTQWYDMVIVLLCTVFAPFKSGISAHDLWLIKLLYSLIFVQDIKENIKILSGKGKRAKYIYGIK